MPSEDKSSIPINLASDNYENLASIIFVSSMIGLSARQAELARNRLRHMVTVDKRALAKVVVPILIATFFFERTKFQRLQVCLTVQPSYVKIGDISFRSEKNILSAVRTVHQEDFAYHDERECFDLAIGLVAEVILAACRKYELDSAPAQSLVEQYAIPRIEFSPLKFSTNIVIEPPSREHRLIDLTPTERLFHQFNRYSWCISAPFTDEQIAKISPDTLNVCVTAETLPDQHALLANAMLSKAPQAALQIEGYASALGAQEDMSFLDCYRYLSRVCFSQSGITNFDFLTRLSPELIRLEIRTNLESRKTAEETLSHFSCLQALRIEGPTIDFAKLPNLKSLRALLLVDTNFKDLGPLKGLDCLDTLIVGSSKVKNLTAITEIGQIKYLSLNRLPQVTDFTFLSSLSKIEYLDLIHLKNLKSLPSFKTLTNLRQVCLIGLKNLADLSAIAEAPNLEQISIFEMKIKNDDVECFKAHPSLRFFQSDNSEIDSFVGLKRPKGGMPITLDDSIAKPLELSQNAAVIQPVIPFEEDDSFLLDSSAEEEMRIQIKISGMFGEEDEIQQCQDLEERVEKLLVDDLLGRWDGHESGLGLYTMFFKGSSGREMIDAVLAELRQRLPKETYFELEDSQGNVEVINL